MCIMQSSYEIGVLSASKPVASVILCYGLSDIRAYMLLNLCILKINKGKMFCFQLKA